MHVQLFKEPYVDFERPEVCRLLFEGVGPTVADEAERCRDFYLYAWIDKSGRLTAFQAVLDEEHVLSWKTGEEPKFGAIGHLPFIRTIVDSAPKMARRKIVRIAGRLESGEFPGLMRIVGLLARGEAVGDPALPDRERKRLRGMLKRRR